MAVSSLADFMEATARRLKAEIPENYGYQADLPMGIGYYREMKTGCKVLEKPVVIPSGMPNNQGYVLLFAYCSEEGVESLLSGQMPPKLPATTKEPSAFESLAAIAENFGAADPQAAAKKNSHCVAFRVPSELANKVDVPGRDFDLWLIRFDQDVVTPFLQAAKEGEVEKLKAAVDHGASAAMVDEDGVSALMMASMERKLEACEFLLSRSADVDGAEPTSNKTPLMCAAQNGDVPLVELLLRSKADPAKADIEGATALMWAAVGGREDAARLLAAAGGLETKNNEGMSALALAEKMGHLQTAAVLKA